MAHVREIETDRLMLRQWRDSDYPPYACMCADAETMCYFPRVLSEEESFSMAERNRALIDVRGWGLWAVEYKPTKQFIGFLGLHVPTVELPFSPCVEIGWRLERHHWGNGLATEGAKAVLDFAFDDLALPEVVSFTSLNNKRSERVMQKLGMVRDALTFQHPALPEGHELREHVLYRKKHPGR
ncbi:GNAT family N-acetyltransferase [Bordetella sp. 02P26C-1]|uniref:GNAT family N-acetyltransferase n=1 Tax=Bordetella sp. 02P26C-1 TaxID=2683195 RepID=UPI001352ED1A|nr:GNAT family N-acetyltransferase [Bordetella sp. 02P26C-1]MVW79616.1 GNAT family N-acetyltransferase [Bordetella sp. 02P26C-1]